MYDVVGVGVCAVDYLGIVPEFPRPDTKNKMKRFIRQGGGTVGTGLVALARLGASVSYLGKLGEDELSRFALEGLAKEGVDVSHVIREEGGGPVFAFVIIDEKTGERTIWWTDEQLSQVEEHQMDKELIASARFLFLDEYTLDASLAAARLAKQGKAKVVLDAERPEKGRIEELVRLTDILIVPEEFAFGFTGNSELESSAQSLLRAGPSVVVITQGKDGSFCRTAEGSFHQPAFEVEVVDTTGCGDVFHGTFIYGMLQEWPLEIVAEFASAVAALKCRGMGGRASIPRWGKVREFLGEEGSAKIKEVLGDPGR